MLPISPSALEFLKKGLLVAVIIRQLGLVMITRSRRWLELSGPLRIASLLREGGSRLPGSCSTGLHVCIGSRGGPLASRVLPHAHDDLLITLLRFRLATLLSIFLLASLGSRAEEL